MSIIQSRALYSACIVRLNRPLVKIAALFSDAVRQRYQKSQKISFLKIVFSKLKVCMGKFQVMRGEDENDFLTERLVLSFACRAE